MPRARALAGAVVAVAVPLTDRTVYSFNYFAPMSYLFVEYGRPQDWLPPLTALHLGAIASSMGLLALLFRPPRSVPRLWKYMAAYLALMAVGILFATNNYRALLATKNFALLLFAAILPIMMFVDSYPRVRTLFRFWVLIHIPITLYALLHHGRGVGAFLGDENDFCLVTNMIAPYCYFLFPVASSRSEKAFLGGTLALFLAGSISSFSRGGFLGLIATGLAVWVRSRRKMVAAIVILFAALTVFLAAPRSYWDEMSTIESSTSAETGTGYARLYLWRIAWRMYLDNPIIGVGAWNFALRSPRYESEERVAQGVHIWGKAAHSLYLTLISEEGTVGALLYFAIAVVGWRERARLRRKYHAMEVALPPAFAARFRRLYQLTLAIDSSLIGFLVTGAFISVLYYPHFWILSAFSVVVCRVFDALAVKVESMRSIASGVGPEAQPFGAGGL